MKLKTTGPKFWVFLEKHYSEFFYFCVSSSSLRFRLLSAPLTDSASASLWTFWSSDFTRFDPVWPGLTWTLCNSHGGSTYFPFSFCVSGESRRGVGGFVSGAGWAERWKEKCQERERERESCGDGHRWRVKAAGGVVLIHSFSPPSLLLLSLTLWTTVKVLERSWTDHLTFFSPFMVWLLFQIMHCAGVHAWTISLSPIIPLECGLLAQH